MGTETQSKKVCRFDSPVEGNFCLPWEVRDEGISLSPGSTRPFRR